MQSNGFWQRSVILLVVFACTSLVLAQSITCPTIVSEAVARADDACATLGRNQVCYGNVSVSASDRDGVAITDFSASGDVIPVEDMAQLITAPLDEATGFWGIALLALQANLPDALPGQNVTFIIFGDASIEIADDAPDQFASPMQAFRLRTGIGRPACDEVPPDGLLVQSPEDVTVNFLVNGVEVLLGSTAYLSLAEDGTGTITTLEGQARVASETVAQVVEAGFSIEVADDQAISEPEPFDAERAAALPIDLLPRRIAIPIVLPANEATVNWIDSGIVVEAGETYQIRASGMTNLWPRCTEFCQDTAEFTCSALCTSIIGGPAGTVAVTDVVASSDPFFVLPGEKFLVLLGRIDEGEPFVVGDDAMLTAESSGTLFFRINEDTRVAGDEPGAYAVSVLQMDDE